MPLHSHIKTLLLLLETLTQKSLRNKGYSLQTQLIYTYRLLNKLCIAHSTVVLNDLALRLRAEKQRNAASPPRTDLSNLIKIYKPTFDYDVQLSTHL